MTSLGYIRKMAAIGELAQDQILSVLREAAADADVSFEDYQALCYAAESVFFPTRESLKRR